MRILDLEINWATPGHPDDRVVWHMPPALPRRVGDMTPAEMRTILAKIEEHLRYGGVLRMSPTDVHRRIILAPGK